MGFNCKKVKKLKQKMGTRPYKNYTDVAVLVGLDLCLW